MGQAKVLHISTCLSMGHAAPPWAAVLIKERVFVFEPVPQVLVQLLKADQPESLQSIGQMNSLQVT
jgi:hypothetical protein